MRLTVVLACACLLALLPSAAEAAPRATDFQLRVGTAGPSESGREWTSRVLRPKGRFDVVGLRWEHARGDLHAELRVRSRGRWRRWVEVPQAHTTRASDPVWAGGADAIQVRVHRRVRGLRLHFVRVRAAAPKARAAARSQASPGGAPAIIPRESWAADQCPPRSGPSMGQVQMAFVHHTVTANEYGPGDSAAMVLGICRFHRNTNGWNDVGYNFLVDKYGQIFEGRAGGIDQPVVGAQAQGWNSQSTGIANLGTYEQVPQTDAAIEAMANLIAWKLPLHGAPVGGDVTLSSGGGESNRHPAGTPVTFNRISAHRDGNETACPGAQLYAQLPRLRDLAASRAPGVIGAPQPVVGPDSRLTLSGSRVALSYPEPAQLAGRLTTREGTPISGVTVRIQVLTAKGFRAVSSATTGPDGGFGAQLPTSRNRVVRALVGRVVSNRVTVTVAPTLGVRTPASRVKAGRRSVLSGTMRPRKAVLVVTAARQVGKRYVHTARVRVRTSNGRFRAAVPLRRPGLYRMRVRFAGDSRNRPAQADHYVRAVRRLASVTGGSGGQAAR